MAAAPAELGGPGPALEPLLRLLRRGAAVNLPGWIQCDSDTSQHIASNLI